MRLSKQGRGKKGRVAPMSDDEDSSGAAGDLHQRDGYQPRAESRGVSFTTSRGKIWLILVVNIAIVTAFIFMSSSRFPSLYGEGAVSDALEQSQQYPGPIYKNSDQSVALASAHSAVTEEPQALETSRPGGYTKLTSTDHPETPDENVLADMSERGTKAPFSGVPTDFNEDPSEPPADLADDPDGELEPTLPSVTQEPYSPVSDVHPADTALTATEEDTSEPPSDAPHASQRSSTEATDFISGTKQPKALSSESAFPPPEQSVEEEPSSKTLTAALQPAETSAEAQPAVIESKAILDNLSMWLTADSGVVVENLAKCLASSGDDITACGVNSWTSQITASSDPDAVDSTAFHPASQQQKPVWVPIVPDTHNQLPAVYFSCPMVTDAMRVHEVMTLFFVLSPAQIETGDSYTGQKFFGNSPYGQFALHGGRPSFFANNGLVESALGVPMGQFSLLAFRLHQGYIQVKVNGEEWSGESPVESGIDDRRVRITVSDFVSLGNIKSACDTNAFQGRIAEVLIYDAVLDDRKVEVVEQYLHDKWWGNKKFPKTAAPPATASGEIEPAPELLHEDEDEGVTGDAPTAAPADPATEATSAVLESEPHAADEVQEASSAPIVNDAAHEATRDEAMLETPAAAAATDEVDVTPAPKFDPRINIFEWSPPSGGEPAKAEQWTRTVREKVDYIRNFQLGGDVLRALIREHKDELVALREELFG